MADEDSSIQTLGGLARAAKLSPERRKEIAAAGAEARWQIRDDNQHSGVPRATHKGVIELEQLKIPCFVLSDGRRVISGRGMTAAIGMKGRGQGIARIASHKAISPFFSNELRLAIESPIQFIGTGSRKAMPAAGSEATVLYDICQAILDARNAGALKTPQEVRYGYQAEILIRAFGKVGINAIVDEVTGYQEDRERDGLQKLLAMYLSEEKLRWAKMFPDEFYKQLFRLMGWQYNSMSVARPGYVGKLTNKLVYDKLPPGVIDELRRKNPVVSDKHHRRFKHFQFLSADLGQPDLRDHLLQLIAIMRVSANWEVFKKNFAIAFPSPGDQFELLAED